MIATEKTVYYPQFPREKSMQCHGVSHGETPVSIMRQRGERNQWQEPLLWFAEEGSGKTR